MAACRAAAVWIPLCPLCVLASSRLCVESRLHRSSLALSGGVMEALADEMMSVIVKTAKDHAMPGTLKGAGITGAAVLARRPTK